LQTVFPDLLIVEYADFSALVASPESISAAQHVQQILQLTLDELGIPLAQRASMFPPDFSYREQLRYLDTLARENNRQGICVLVSNIDGYVETRANRRLAADLVRHLVGNRDLYAAPRLYLKLFLPPFLSEHLIEYQGLASRALPIIDPIAWKQEMDPWLNEVLALRLGDASRHVTGDRGNLNLFCDEAWSLGEFTLNDHILRLADGSPERLFDYCDRLLQHRAQTWQQTQASAGDGESYVSEADLVALLQYLSTHRFTAQGSATV
jgi:hypothetical protein